jgi:hypothetical protein
LDQFRLTPVHFAGQPLWILELKLVADVIPVDKLRCVQGINLIKQGSEVSHLSSAGEDVRAPLKKRHSHAVVWLRYRVGTLSKNVTLQMTSKVTIEVLAERVQVLAWIQLLDMHVSGQNCQWLRLWVGKPILVRRERAIQFIDGEVCASNSLQHFLDEHIERQSLNVAVGLGDVGCLGENI